MEGRSVIRAKVSPSGTVVSAEPIENRGLSDEVVKCVIRVIERATFEPPGGLGGTLHIPITYVQGDAGGSSRPGPSLP